MYGPNGFYVLYCTNNQTDKLRKKVMLRKQIMQIVKLYRNHQKTENVMLISHEDNTYDAGNVIF